MRSRIAVVLGGIVLVLAVGWGARAEEEDGEDRRAPASPQEALEAALARGKELFTTPWVEGGKTCASCHAQGANQLRADRLKAYPKYDLRARRLLTGQEKLRQMIETQAKGEAPALGHADLTALEAYISTL